jgi:hypothetical protein
MQQRAWERVLIEAQSVEAPRCRERRCSWCWRSGGRRGIRTALGSAGDLVKNVGFRDLGSAGHAAATAAGGARAARSRPGSAFQGRSSVPDPWRSRALAPAKGSWAARYAYDCARDSAEKQKKDSRAKSKEKDDSCVPDGPCPAGRLWLPLL